MDEFVSKRLKQLRLEKNYTQEHLSKILNMSSSAYSRMERGASSTWPHYLKKICDFYHISIVSFFSTYGNKEDKVEEEIQRLQNEVTALKNHLSK